MAEKEKQVDKKPTERFVVGQVATQTEDVIVDNKDNKTYTSIDFLAKIGNDIDLLKKLLD